MRKCPPVWNDLACRRPDHPRRKGNYRVKAAGTRPKIVVSTATAADSVRRMRIQPRRRSVRAVAVAGTAVVLILVGVALRGHRFLDGRTAAGGRADAQASAPH